MADINFCTLGTSTIAASITTGTAGAYSVNNVIDGYQGGHNHHFYWIEAALSGSNAVIDATVTVTFENAADITRVESWHFIHPTPGYAPPVTVKRVQLYYDSSWNSILTISGRLPNQQVASGDWESVTKIRYELDMSSAAASYAVAMGELRAWGTVSAATVDYDDEGIRMYDGTDTISIAVRDATDDDVLRIYDGSDVKGIILVATTDSYASKFRVYDGSDVKSIRKL